MKYPFQIIFLFSLLPAVSLFAMGSKVEMKPAGIIKPGIVNMEYQKYAGYNRGELTGYHYFVYTISDDGKTMVLHRGFAAD
jgi:hypothetical protein